MIYEIISTSQFKKDLKRAIRRKNDVTLLENVVQLLGNEEGLPAKHRDHALTGNWKAFRECHIASDWLLIYQVDRKELALVLVATGTHVEVFRSPSPKSRR